LKASVWPSVLSGTNSFKIYKSFASGNFFTLRLSAKVENAISGKEVSKMKIVKLSLTLMTLTAALGLSAVSTRAETVISNDVFSNGSYCHTKFESIREGTLASSEPVLKDVDDIVDFYGPCNHDPLGKEEIQAQRIEEQHRFATEYED